VQVCVCALLFSKIVTIKLLYGIREDLTMMVSAFIIFFTRTSFAIVSLNVLVYKQGIFQVCIFHVFSGYYHPSNHFFIMKKIAGFLLFGILTVCQVKGQPDYISINGKVANKITRQPITYASVYIKGKTIGATTNEEGHFVFHIPTAYAADTLVISAIGYQNFAMPALTLRDKESYIELEPSAQQLSNVVIRSSQKKLTGKDIVRKAVENIPENYPMQPFALEAFFKDLQFENEKPVELLEAATLFTYKDYNPGYEEVAILEVRRNFNKRHPVNGTYDRQNSIIDLMEDNFIKERFGPVGMKGWKFSIDSVLSYDDRPVYKIKAVKNKVQEATLFIDQVNFSIIKIDLTRKMVDGKFYKRWINLPDPYGMQETSYRMVFEYKEVEGKMYLKYQREEDTYNIFNKTTNEVAIRQSFMKELFVTNIVTNAGGSQPVYPRMNMNKSIESQANSYNEKFWLHYNSPLQTARESEIVKELAEAEKERL
jgi:hypothetical protein